MSLLERTWNDRLLWFRFGFPWCLHKFPTIGRVFPVMNLDLKILGGDWRTVFGLLGQG
jgi:hypothetical protein